MAIQSFSSGQTLTAAQMSALQANDYNLTATTKTATYTLVAGDVGTRVIGNAGTAITFTVPNSTFTAGDSVQVHNVGAGTVTVAAGTGLTLNSADVLTLGQYQSGTIYFTSASAAILFPTAKTAAASSSGLVCVQAETSFSASSSVTADSVFTSTYTNYLVIINWTASGGELRMKLRASGTSTSTNYNYQRTQVSGASLSGSTTETSQTSYVGPNTAGSFQSSGNYYINSPQLAQVTTVQASYSWQTGAYTSPNTYQSSGNQNSSTQFDGIEFVPGSGTITGNYAIYGFSKTV